jgi:hypothetical protein
MAGTFHSDLMGVDGGVEDLRQRFLYHILTRALVLRAATTDVGNLVARLRSLVHVT